MLLISYRIRKSVPTRSANRADGKEFKGKARERSRGTIMKEGLSQKAGDEDIQSNISEGEPQSLQTSVFDLAFDLCR